MDRSHIQFLNNEESFLDEAVSPNPLDQTKAIDHNNDAYDIKYTDPDHVEDIFSENPKTRNTF